MEDIDTNKIRCAPNAKALNKVFPENAAIISQGTGMWAFTVSGQVQTGGATFQESKSAAVDYFEARACSYAPLE